MYRRGPNNRRWLSANEKVPPSVQRGLLKGDHPPSNLGRLPDPGYRIIEGARFTIPIVNSNGVSLPSYPLNNGVMVHSRRINTDLGRAAVQVYNDSTILLSFAKITLAPEALPDVNRILWGGAMDALRLLSKELGMHLGVPQPKPDPKAANAELPLITGEIVKPIPGMENISARIAISSTTELNGSPPGLSMETADILEAVADAGLAGRVTALERYQVQLVTMHERTNTLLESQNEYLKLLAESIEKMNELMGAMKEIEPAAAGPEIR